VSRFRAASGSADEGLFAEINITPFTDVVLVLLIIFMVTAPLMYEGHLQVKLPQASTASSAPEDHPTVGLTATARSPWTASLSRAPPRWWARSGGRSRCGATTRWS